MFTKIKQTAFPPTEKPMMVWDGECGFCEYWITNWKSKTAARIDYRTYQEVAEHFKDIPLKEFKKASRLIEPDGFVYSGPDSAYKSLQYFKKPSLFWHDWYARYKIFNFISDHSYNFIAKNRSLMFSLSKTFFGKNPQRLRSYWLLWAAIIFIVIYLLLGIL